MDNVEFYAVVAVAQSHGGAGSIQFDGGDGGDISGAGRQPIRNSLSFSM